MPNRALALGLRLSSMSLVFAGFLSLASVNAYGAPMFLLPLVLFLLMPIGERLDARFSGYRSLTRAFTIAYGCFIPMTAIVFDLMDAVIMLVIYVIAYTLMHLKQERNYYHLFLMACFLLLAACVQSPEPVIGLVMMMFFISAIWAFTTLRLYQEILDSQGYIAQEIKAPGPLGNKGSWKPAFFEPGFMTFMFFITTFTLAVTVLIFMVTPRIEAGMLGRSDSYFTQTGLSQSIDFTGGTFVQEDPTPVMHVEFPDEPNGEYEKAPLLYWRNTTLPKYTGTQWIRRAMMYHYEPLTSDGASSDRFNHLIRARRPETRLVNQRIYLNEIPAGGLPALHLVREIDVQSNSSVDIEWDHNRDLTVHASLKGLRRISYEAVSEVRDIPLEDIQNSNTNYMEFMYPQDYFMLTEHDLTDESIAIAESLMNEQPTVFDKAMVVQRWLSSAEFLYTLEVPILPPNNAVDAFLNQLRRGHCELFASAMVLMLRSQGIPARVVSGYRGGEWEEFDRSYTVRANMAHLWVEVLFPEYGWIIFDPSPRSSDMYASGLGRIRALALRNVLKAQMFWYREIEGYDRGLQLAHIQDATIGLFRRIAGTGDPQQRTQDASVVYERARLIRPIAMGVATIIALFLIFRISGNIQIVGKKWKLNADQQRAIQLYRKLCKRLSKLGIACEGKTSGEVQLAAEMLNGRIDLTPVQETIQLYNEVRFGYRDLDPARINVINKKIGKLRLKSETGTN